MLNHSNCNRSFIRQIFLVLIMMLVFSAPCSSAFADSVDDEEMVQLTLVNRTDFKVVAGYFNPAGNVGDFRDNLSDYIYPGESYVVSLRKNCRYWDCKFVLDNGKEAYKYHLDMYEVHTLYIDL